MRIGLDVMGGDFAPEATIKGAVLAHDNFKEQDEIVLFGDEKTILEQLEAQNASPDDFSIVHSEEEIGMSEHPTRAFKTKPKSSISLGFGMLRNKEIDAFASAGNTGAMLVGSIHSVSTVHGITRPATAAVFPRVGGGDNIILDVGTNVDTKPENLFEFAILGKLYAEHVFHVEAPKVGLLSIGAEKEKGNQTTKAAYQLLETAQTFEFVGNVEGRDLFRDKADVIVCDGFTGNVALKQAESFYRIMTKRGVKDEYLERFNYENHGGTPILGTNAPVMVGHGISNAIAFKNMLLHAKEMAHADLPSKIEQSVIKNIQNR